MVPGIVSEPGVAEPNGHYDGKIEPAAAPNGVNGHANGLTDQTKPRVVEFDPIFKPRQMRVICIGAGIAGIAAAYKYQRNLTNTSFVIYEKNEDVGGTWFENRYPGCACDIPAHGYTYSWEGNPEWTRFYVEAPEIHAYFKSCAVKWNCMQYIKLKHRVVGATWDAESSQWKVKIENLEDGTIIDDSCDVLISATGVLNNWKWPAIEGIHSFQGKLLHSARWDASYDFTGKTVAIIGAGSSAIQIVPKLQPLVKNMLNFIRSATWITPEFSEALASEGRETRFTPEEIERFKTDKKYFLEYRKKVQNFGSANYPLFYKGSELQQKAFKNFSGMMRKRLQDREELCSKIIPKFPVGCRRFTPGSGFLEALVKPNATVITEEIECITSEGLRTVDGVEHKVDAIVCATGFDCSYRPAFPVIGLNGRSLAEDWKDGPRHYLSVAAPGFPNYFIAGGPNSPIANGSLISGLETEIDYAYMCLKKMQTENIASMDITEEAVNDFLEHKDKVMAEMVWSGGCHSWYKHGGIDGPVTGPWCGSTWHFNEALAVPRFEDYNLKFRHKNRFNYLGNGRTMREINGADMATHLSEPGA